MSHTWVDGEVITAEKLNGMCKEPLVIKSDEIEEGEIYYTYDNGEMDNYSGKYIVKDISKYLNIYCIEEEVFTSSRVTFLTVYEKFIVYPYNISEVKKDHKCIIKETTIISLDFNGNNLYIISDPTAIANGTKDDDK